MTEINPPYHEVTVEVSYEDDNGKIKKKKEPMLTDAQSVSEAEANINHYFKDVKNYSFKVLGSKESKIKDIVPNIAQQKENNNFYNDNDDDKDDG